MLELPSKMMEGWSGVQLGAVGSLLLMIVTVVYFFYPTWKLRHIPVPPYQYVLGHAPLLIKHEAKIWTMLAKDYGPLYRFQLGRQPMVMVTDAELVRQVGLKMSKQIPNRSNPATMEGNPLKDALFFSRDEQWAGMKNILLPMFQTDKMVNYAPLMTRSADELIERLGKVGEGEEVNMTEILQRMTMDVIGEAAFGTKFGLLSEQPGPDNWLVKAAVESVNGIRMCPAAGTPLSTIVGTFLPILQKPSLYILRSIPGTMEWRGETSNRALKSRLKQIQEKRKQLMKEPGFVSRVDSLSLLLTSSMMNKQNKKLLTANYIGALAYEMSLAGSETSSVTLSILVYLLTQYPDVEKKLLAEIDAFGSPDLPITMEDLDTKFPYLQMVLDESMRFYSTSPAIAREASEDIELGGYHLPKGTWIWLVLEAVHFDPKDWPNPEEFRPERFDPNSEEAKKRHPYSFLPFGIGPRSCLGRRFAVQEMKLVIIRLYQNFTFSLSPLTKVPLETQYGIVIRPKHGVHVRVHPRRTHL